MSPLPQRKKSVEELAKLRESLGIPGLEPGKDTVPAKADSVPAAPESSRSQTTDAADSQASAETIPAAREPKEVRSLRRSERVVVLLPDGERPVEKLPAVPAAVELPIATKPAVHPAKVVRSLRRSEQGSVGAPTAKPVPDSKLPVHRHSDEEINRIRRMEAIGAMGVQEKPRNLAAHLALVIPGYLLVLAGAGGVYFYNSPLVVTAALAGAALLIALFIFIRKPLSRHHGAFIFVGTLLLTVFGTLHYFPQFQYGT